MYDEKTNCIICDKELALFTSTDKQEQPMGGIEFASYGAYGSGIYDPLKESRIFMSICDECAIEKVKSGHIKGDIDNVSLILPSECNMEYNPENGVF